MSSRKTWIKVGISLGLLIWLFNQTDLADIVRPFRHFQRVYLWPVVFLSLAGILLSVWKWSLLLLDSGIQVPFFSLLRLFWIGLFFNNFLPGRTGGDLVRAYGLARHTRQTAPAALSVLIDRGLNLLALIAIGACAFFIGADAAKFQITLSIPWIIGLAFLTAVMGYTGLRLLQTERARQWRQTLHQVVCTLLKNPKRLLQLTGLAMFYQTTMISGHVAFSQGLDQHIHVVHFFYLIPITALATLLPISLNGIGLRESAFAIAFSQVGLPIEHAVALSVGITATTMAMSLIGGIFYIKGESTTISKSPIEPVTSC